MTRQEKRARIGAINEVDVRMADLAHRVSTLSKHDADAQVLRETSNLINEAALHLLRHRDTIWMEIQAEIDAEAESA